MSRTFRSRRGPGGHHDREAEAFLREAYPFPILAVAVGILILSDVAVAMVTLFSLSG
jgi:hypothetical protein